MGDLSKMSKTEKGEGNKQPPLPSLRFQSVKWVLTWNNYPENVLEQLSKVLVPLCKKYVFYKEVGEEGTKHIQGAFILNKKMRQGTIYKLLGHTFWLDKMKGKWNDQKYCIKQGGEGITNVKFRPSVVKMTKHLLRPEQLQIAELFDEDEDYLFGRKVYWFWEPEGNWGKSILCKYLIDQQGAFVVQGANKDILCGLSSYIEKNGFAPRLVVFDIPRVNQGHVSYQAIESIKNGFFFSGKYESGMVRFNSPHICILSNEEPEVHKLSQDRWIITKLKRGKLAVVGGQAPTPQEDESDIDYDEFI